MCREEQKSCLNQTSFSLFFYFGKSEILLKSNVIKSKNYCILQLHFRLDMRSSDKIKKSKDIQSDFLLAFKVKKKCSTDLHYH